jgi:type IV pilus assembly protein PilC
MPTYAYAGRTRSGDRVSGERSADSMEAVVALLRREQIVVTRVEPVRSSRAAGARTGKSGTVPARSLAVFTRQFSVMIDAGLPLVQCLEILGKQEPHKGFAQVIQATRAEVEAGASLADAMRKFPKTFDPLYTNLIAAGEAGGILDAILQRLSTYIEKSVKLKSQVRSAMIYPIAVMVIAAGAVGLILWKVIPTFAALFDGLGAALPLPTRIVISASESFIFALPIILAAGGGGTFGLRWYYATEAGCRRIDALLLRLPVLGPILRKVAVARFCRTLATLLSSGVPILEGLDITGRTAGNVVVQGAVMTTRSSIERGESVSGPLENTQVFPPMVTQMIGVGEATGALDTMLGKIADFYEEEVDAALAGLATLLEPVMIAFLGVVVGGIVIAMYLPIFELIKKLA